MKKPTLIGTTVRLFPDMKSEAATTQTAIKGHLSRRLYYSPLNSKENPFIHILRKCLAPHMFSVEPWKKRVSPDGHFFFAWHDRKIGDAEVVCSLA